MDHIVRWLLRFDDDYRPPADRFADELQPIRLLVSFEEEEFPDEFRDVLTVKVLGYRNREIAVDGRLVRLLDPIWTLVPKDD